MRGAPTHAGFSFKFLPPAHLPPVQQAGGFFWGGACGWASYDPHVSEVPESPRPQPRSLSDLFFSLSFLALQGFGGVLAVVQRELVERKRWMTREEFVEEWAVAQIMPGPNVVNLSLMIGNRYFGLRGALVAVAGMLAFPLLVVLALVLAYSHFAGQPQVLGALRGMGAVASGLVIATALKLAPTLKKSALGIPACAVLAALTFAGVGGLRWPMAWVVLALGSGACVLAWRRLR